MQETWVQFLGWDEPLEEGMATHSSTLAWRIPMDRGAWRAIVYEVAELDLTERLSTESKAQKKKRKHSTISIIWIYHSLFIHLSTEGHLGCFQVLTIMNKAAMHLM